MGLQAVVVFIGIAIALAVGIGAGSVENGERIVGWLAIGLVPVTWTVLYVTERMIGRKIWHYTAPYPYRTRSQSARID